MTDFANIKIKKDKFRVILVASYLVFTLLLVGAITVVHIKLSGDVAKSEITQNIYQEMENNKIIIDGFANQKISQIEALSHSAVFLNFVNGIDTKYADNLFLSTVEANLNYMQLRYISVDGYEKIRIDRESYGEKPFIIEPSQLQNKKDRYYFNQCCLLPDGKIWFSKIDLNYESGELEVPIKPTIRIATPVYQKGELKGFLIANIFVCKLLDALKNSYIFDTMIIDQKGYILRSDNTLLDWSEYFSKKTIFDLGYDKRNILTKKPNFDESKNSLIFPFFIGDYKYLVIKTLNTKHLQQKEDIKDKIVVVILMVVLFLALLFAFLLSRPFDKLYHSLLEKSKNLDTQVKNEIEKNQQKDRMLHHQSRLSALGELIAMITHQWRHPITRVSLQLQNINQNLKSTTCDRDRCGKLINSSISQINFLSETIENFKDFYQRDTPDYLFNFKDVFESVYLIVGDIFTHHNIKITYEEGEKIEIYGNKNEFSQVILNLFINAKDAFLEQKVKNPTLTLIAKKENNTYKIIIQDNGKGIAEEFLDKIFLPYKSTKGNDGSGIGLYISKIIIEEHFKGTIKAYNDNGAVFEITLLNTVNFYHT